MGGWGVLEFSPLTPRSVSMSLRPSTLSIILVQMSQAQSRFYGTSKGTGFVKLTFIKD